MSLSVTLLKIQENLAENNFIINKKKNVIYKYEKMIFNIRSFPSKNLADFKTNISSWQIYLVFPEVNEYLQINL